jgi:hypothetical protein
LSEVLAQSRPPVTRAANIREGVVATAEHETAGERRRCYLDGRIVVPASQAGKSATGLDACLAQRRAGTGGQSGR